MVTSPENDPAPVPTADLPVIRGFLPSTLIDWPGRIAAMVFLPLCNLRCGYCHAGDLLDPASDEVLPWPQIREYLEGKRSWIDGVVICGGEPTLHATLANLCREIHSLGMAVKLDTNGTRPDVLGRLISERLIEAVSMDLKTSLDQRMAEFSGGAVDLAALESSVALLLAASSGGGAAAGASSAAADEPCSVIGDAEHCRKPSREDGARPQIEVEFRTTCCPALVDAEAIEWIARRIGASPERPEGSPYVLQRFNPEHAMSPAFREIAPYSAGQMEELLEVARRWNPRTRLRTG